MTDVIDPRWRRIQSEDLVGGVVEEYWVDSDDRRQGPYVKRFPNGVKREAGLYRDGRQEGLWSRWYPSGRRREETTFRAGVQEGLATRWFESGRLHLRGFLRNGKLNGDHITGFDEGRKVLKCHGREGRLVKVLSFRDRRGRETVLGRGTLSVWMTCVHLLPAGRTTVYVRLRVPRRSRRVTPQSEDHLSRIEFGIIEVLEDLNGHRFNRIKTLIDDYEESMVVEMWIGREIRHVNFDPDPSHRDGEGIRVAKYRDHCVAQTTQ